jgi:hypothetical protein
MTAVQNGKHDALNSLLDSAEDEAPRGEELADDELHQRLQGACNFEDVQSSVVV